MSQSYYSFIPYVRRGIATGINDNEDLLGTGTAGSVASNALIKLRFNASNQNNQPIVGINEDQGITENLLNYYLMGPGDIIGLQPNSVIRTTPPANSSSFECNYLAAVDFYDEDFPWRYTPLMPTSKKLTSNGNDLEVPAGNANLHSKLRPWLFPVALKRNEFTIVEGPLGRCLKLIADVPGKTYADVFPNEKQLWAWAHVQVNNQLQASNLNTSLATQIQENSDSVISRIVCPRRLDPNTAYTVFLIPVFELGRLAGIKQLGEVLPSGVNIQTPSWRGNETIGANGKLFPIYYTWEFSTLSRFQDFESLVRKLEPKVLSLAQAGNATMAINEPGYPKIAEAFNPNITSPPLQNTKPYYGTITPLTANNTLPQLNEWNLTATPQSKYVNELVNLLNHTNKFPAATTISPSPDPIIGPPMYGQWHMQRDSIASNANNWFTRVNLDPTYRAAAGAGAAVVKKHQEYLMDIAWSQVGEIVELNKHIVQLQQALQAIKAMYNRNIPTNPADNFSAGNTLSYAAPLVKHILLESQQETLHAQIEESILPTNSLSGRYRRMISANGPVMRKLDPTAAVVSSGNHITASLSDASLSVAPVYTAPVSLSYCPPAIEAAMTVSAVSNLPAAENFWPVQPGITYSVYTGNNTNVESSAGVSFRAAVSNLHEVIEARPVPEPPKPNLNWNNFLNTLRTHLNPNDTFIQLANQLYYMYKADTGSSSIQHLDIVLAAPRIPVSMAEMLAELNKTLFMPGIEKVEQNGVYNFGVNQKIIEAYLAGANYEMNRELLWREYPTDQRGTPLRHFWGINGLGNVVGSDPKYMDILDIHTWKTNGVPKDLGENTSRKLPNGTPVPPENIMVLAIRGELIANYPNTLVYARKAKWQLKDGSTTQQERVPDAATEANLLRPLFFTRINPDLYFMGFNLNPTTAKGQHNPTQNQPGWFITFEERAGEPVFGADEVRTKPNLVFWYELGWNDIFDGEIQQNFVNINKIIEVNNAAENTFVWGRNSADQAYATYQNPSRIFIHASDLLN